MTTVKEKRWFVEYEIFGSVDRKGFRTEARALAYVEKWKSTSPSYGRWRFIKMYSETVEVAYGAM